MTKHESHEVQYYRQRLVYESKLKDLMVIGAFLMGSLVGLLLSQTSLFAGA